jgi:hypothetical protein
MITRAVSSCAAVLPSSRSRVRRPSSRRWFAFPAPASLLGSAWRKESLLQPSTVPTVDVLFPAEVAYALASILCVVALGPLSTAGAAMGVRHDWRSHITNRNFCHILILHNYIISYPLGFVNRDLVEFLLQGLEPSQSDAGEED